MSITNIDRPSSSVTNATKINIGETWATITTTWATETRTWGDMASLISNINLGVSGFLWSVKRFPWTEATPWTTDGGISNIAKP